MGFGGQGIILMGRIIGNAMAIYGGKEVIFMRSYGPEARGGACRADVVVAEEKIRYPVVRQPDVLVAMSQEAYEKFSVNVKHRIFIDEYLIHPNKLSESVEILSIPAVIIAERIGARIAANIVMLGFLCANEKWLDPEAVKKSILSHIPKGTEDINMKAFEEGLKYAYSLKKVDGR